MNLVYIVVPQPFVYLSQMIKMVFMWGLYYEIDDDNMPLATSIIVSLLVLLPSLSLLLFMFYRVYQGIRMCCKYIMLFVESLVCIMMMP
jgi:hypothetical protein